jgi:hypothetical protein
LRRGGGAGLLARAGIRPGKPLLWHVTVSGVHALHQLRRELGPRQTGACGRS